MYDWRRKISEAIGRIRSRYEFIGRKTGAPFLAVVYPSEVETAFLKEWRTQCATLQPEIDVRSVDVLELTHRIITEIGAANIVSSMVDPMPGSDPQAELGGLWVSAVAESVDSNPSDRDLIDALRVARKFDKAELILEETEVEPDVLTEARKFVMKLAKKRGIDETPAAISEAAEALATAILAQAGDVTLWASGSAMPLPVSFIDGTDAWHRVLDLTNPVHRVNEIHSSQTTLRSGFEAIGQHAAFQKQSGQLFKELTDLVKRLEAVEHRVDPPCAIASILTDYRAAASAASFADKDVWNSLQTHKNQALLELTPLLDGWRGEARTILDQALERLPNDLSERNLDGALYSSLSEPLVQLRDSLDAATMPAQVAAFPDRARQLVRNLGQRIVEEVAKKQRAEHKPDVKTSGKTPPTLPCRQVRFVRTKSRP
jgi:hypothetical protein